MALGTFLLGFYQSGVACTCSIAESFGKSEHQLVEKAKKDADVVFVGKIVEIRFSSTRSTEGKPTWRYARFKIETLWKGDLDTKEFIEIGTANLCCICGVNFEEGDRYLVYARTHDSGASFTTNSCTRTTVHSASGGDLRYLGKPTSRKTEKKP